MDTVKVVINCILGPRLHHFYKLTGNTLASTTPQVLSRTHQYSQNPLESASDYVIRVTQFITSFSTYMSPVIFSYLLYKRNKPDSYISTLDHHVLFQLCTTAIGLFVSSFCIRGLARYSNPEYREFLRALEEAKRNPSVSNKRILVHFDSDLSAFPYDFRWSDARDQRAPVPYAKSFPEESAIQSHLLIDDYPIIRSIKLPIEVILSVIMRTLGRRMIYPGSSSILQSMMQPAIVAGRSKLIEEHEGMRNKLLSYDGNAVDTMFIDRRGASPNGDYLVICCEGNSGFYELGSLMTPLEAGYSVLGWNHPGFGGSTGVPYPDQDVAAIDIVLKFALDKLSFSPSQIVIYGWSIGGFTATWAGMRFPNIHGLVIDASFDHILPLARNIFPSFLYPCIELAIRQHFDLNNSRHLRNYNGPVLLIRRSQDELIATDPYNSPPTNRANYLLIDLLRSRFPKLIDDRAEAVIKEYLGGNARYQAGVLRRYAVNNTTCLRLLMDHFHRSETSYPVNIGPDLDNTTRDQLTLFLVSKHLVDYDSVHCAPLPVRYFQRPWNLLAMNRSNL